MNKHILLLLAAVTLASASAQSAVTATSGVLNTDLRLYQDFAEVRTPITSSGTRLDIMWPQSAWSGLIRESLNLEGLPYKQAVHRRGENWLRGLEGRPLTLLEDGQKQTVTLVRADDVLIRDVDGMYRRVNLADLAFPEVPPGRASEPLMVTSFDLEGAGSGTLTYLTHSLSWTPRYTLTVDSGGTPLLSALADITNGTNLAYQVAGTELLAGDVSLVTSYVSGFDPSRVTQATFASGEYAAAPANISARESLNGIYRYALTEALSLPAESTVTLPFMQPGLSEFESYAGLERGFNPSNDSGVLNRMYRFKADLPLPGGNLTVREGNRLTGQTRIRETAPGQPVDFILGRDPDVSYDRTVKMLAESRVSRTYQVTYLLESAKKTAVKVELTENTYNDRVTLSGEGVTKQGGSAQIKLELPAEGKVTRTFKVVIPQ
ncbi:hypothetical protein ACFP81_15080 [Deinococcus lacus]|uniref:DUF4139 domain-containing protein n=1 Tax=Deinococcus lacus TaxID=392561 RepID=A0ABW1YGI3_9DEIO